VTAREGGVDERSAEEDTAADDEKVHAQAVSAAAQFEQNFAPGSATVPHALQ
jgi:hypothetical protein